MKPIRLLPVVKTLAALLASTFALSAGPAEVRVMVNSLPGKLEVLTKKHERGLSGSTMEMVESIDAVAKGILIMLVDLEGEGEGGEAKAKLRAELEQDAAGVAAGVFYRNHATGWGGTITQIEAAAAVQEYYEHRLSFNVTQLYRDDETFNLDQWHRKWRKAGGGGGDDEADAEETETGIQISPQGLRFSRGSTGGATLVKTEALAGKQIPLGASADQHMLIACSGLKIRLLKMGGDGKPVAFTEFKRCHDIVLPASKGGKYLLEFAAGDGVGEMEFLVEIR